MAESQRILPQGWNIVGYWTGFGIGRPDYTELDKPNAVTDDEIAGADRIIVTYTSRRTGTVTYRTVYGAETKVQVGSLIRNTVRVESPVGRGN